ncbi:hypothetical protein [Arthrobacter sp. NA-172]|uniref:hypothetical protein n=1 Tax=Arthrobacter sp. NA-172 TaxID=3367524 RepID=UPI003755247E
MNITDTPSSVDAARALAQAIADRAGCGSLEDYDVNGQTGRWTFTCQMNDATFDITAYGSPKARSEQEAQLRFSGWQYWSKDSYTVVAIPKSTSKSASGAITPDLEPFKKALDHSTK